MKELSLDVVGTHYTLALEQDATISVRRNGKAVPWYTPNALTVALVRGLFDARKEIETLKKALSADTATGDTYD
jgi:hypothetical protein